MGLSLDLHSPPPPPSLLAGVAVYLPPRYLLAMKAVDYNLPTTPTNTAHYAIVPPPPTPKASIAISSKAASRSSLPSRSRAWHDSCVTGDPASIREDPEFLDHSGEGPSQHPSVKSCPTATPSAVGGASGGRGSEDGVETQRTSTARSSYRPPGVIIDEAAGKAERYSGSARVGPGMSEEGSSLVFDESSFLRFSRYRPIVSGPLSPQTSVTREDGSRSLFEESSFARLERYRPIVAGPSSPLLGIPTSNGARRGVGNAPPSVLPSPPVAAWPGLGGESDFDGAAESRRWNSVDYVKVGDGSQANQIEKDKHMDDVVMRSSKWQEWGNSR